MKFVMVLSVASERSALADIVVRHADDEVARRPLSRRTPSACHSHRSHVYSRFYAAPKEYRKQVEFYKGTTFVHFGRAQKKR